MAYIHTYINVFLSMHEYYLVQETKDYRIKVPVAIMNFGLLKVWLSLNKRVVILFELILHLSVTSVSRGGHRKPFDPSQKFLSFHRWTWMLHEAAHRHS